MRVFGRVTIGMVLAGVAAPALAGNVDHGDYKLELKDGCSKHSQVQQAQAQAAVVQPTLNMRCGRGFSGR